MNRMLSKYFNEEGLVDETSTLDSLVCVFDSLPVYDAFKVVGRDGEVVKGEKKKGFLGSLADLGGAVLKDVVANVTGSEVDAWKQITGLKALGDWYDKQTALSLHKMTEEDLEDLARQLRDSGEYENAGDLLAAVNKELSARRVDRRSKSQTEIDALKARVDKAKKELAEVEKKLEAAKGELEGTEGELGDADEEVIKDLEEQVEEQKEALAEDEALVEELDEGEEEDAWEERLEKAVEKVYEEGDEGDEGESLPFPILTDLEPVAYGRVDLPKGAYLLTAWGVSSQTVRDFTVQWVIDEIIDIQAYKSYCKIASGSGVSPEEVDDAAALVAVSTENTEELGMDFMDYVISNEVSGDLEVDFGFLPVRDMSRSFIAVVNTTNNAFSIFTSAVLRSTMVPVVEGVVELQEESDVASDVASELSEIGETLASMDGAGSEVR